MIKDRTVVIGLDGVEHHISGVMILTGYRGLYNLRNNTLVTSMMTDS